jgi:hypothetical protein
MLLSMKKVLGLILSVMVIATVTVALNLQGHAKPTLADIATWSVSGLIIGCLYVVAQFAIGLPLMWFVRRRRRPPGDAV